MTSWTERYLEAVLRSIPEAKRTDVERELRSSIDDAVEERVAAGEDRVAVERSVLEGLGDPAQLASGYTGRPNYLLGPELFPLWRSFLPRLIAGVVPLVAIVMIAVTLASGGGLGDAIGAGIDAAISVLIQVAFWTTLVFIFLERAESAREARTELLEKAGRWKLEKLPEKSPGRVTAGEAVGEVITVLITIGGLLFLRNLGEILAPGTEVPFFDPVVTGFWLPVLIVVLGALAVLQVGVFLAGRWTMPLAVVYAVLELAFALPVVWLALNGTLVNHAFAAEVGYPELAVGDGVVMLAVAVFTSLVTAWEIASTFLRARGARPLASMFGVSRRST